MAASHQQPLHVVRTRTSRADNCNSRVCSVIPISQARRNDRERCRSQCRREHTVIGAAPASPGPESTRPQIHHACPAGSHKGSNRKASTQKPVVDAVDTSCRHSTHRSRQTPNRASTWTGLPYRCPESDARKSRSPLLQLARFSIQMALVSG